MKKAFLAIWAFVSTVLFGTVQASAAGLTPAAGDKDWWIYVVLAIVALAMVVVLVVTGKRKK